MTMRARRGSALILVLLMTLAIAGLSIAAIFMSSSAGLLSTFYDREREYRNAAEAGIAMVRARMNQDVTFAIADTGMVQLLAGQQVRDASGVPLGRVRVNVYASITGDTSSTGLPSLTLIASAYDEGGTRYVARTDFRRESFSRYALFTDSFPSALNHGPATVSGRVHSNGNLRLSGSGNRYRDTVTVVGTVSGTGTFEIDSVVGVPRIAYPKDSTYSRLDTLAAAANLSFPLLTGGSAGTRLEFVAYDVDGDGTVEAAEGFARIFDATSTSNGSSRLRASPSAPSGYYSATDPIVQNQCGAFYLRRGRWHFFPIVAHRRPYAEDVIRDAGAADAYPNILAWPPGQRDRMRRDDATGAATILGLPTARCFSVGSPFLMPSERMTDAAGVHWGDVLRDSMPFGVVPPSGGWPSGRPYGGSDTTFSIRSRNCGYVPDGPTTTCTVFFVAPVVEVGAWRVFPGGPIASAPDSVVQARELPFLWPLSPPHNPTSRRVVSATGGTLYVSGRVAGNVTLRVAGPVVLIDRLTYVRDPNDANVTACTDQLGIVAVGDIVVVNGLTARVRQISTGGSAVSSFFGNEPRFTVHGSLMSLTGSVGVESPTTTMGTNPAQLPCPDDGVPLTDSNGGCLAVVGGMVMRVYRELYGGTNTGFRYRGAPDRCQTTANRPPFFPLTNRYTFLRTLSLLPTDANTPAKIRTMLMRLKGKAL